ncbi:MAG: chemotaxis protein CheB [Bacterioplanes sp.]|nr:chemotaxis protein CheB [Bacterioplanes sp.]
MALPRIGILADDRLQQHLLKSALVHFGFDVVINTDPSRFEQLNLAAHSLDAWLVDVRDEDNDDYLDLLERLLEGPVPVLIGTEPAPKQHCLTFPKWEKRLYGKLRTLLNITPLIGESATALQALPEQQQSARIPLPSVFQVLEPADKPNMVWVLGASLGGPEAVKAFLDALPGGLPVAFIYAQHIDPRFEESLCKTIGRHSEYTLKNFEAGVALQRGDVLVAPIENEFCFDHSGFPFSQERAWPGPYGPSIDQVILNVYAHYGVQAGYILFSGMGNDGAEAIVGLPKPHGPIWAQASHSCANSSMPDSAVGTNQVSYVGDPYQLALQLVNYMKHHGMRQHEPT